MFAWGMACGVILVVVCVMVSAIFWSTRFSADFSFEAEGQEAEIDELYHSLRAQEHRLDLLESHVGLNQHAP